VKVHSLTLSGLFALLGACDVTPGSTSRPATSQPPCLGRKPNARVATRGTRRKEKLTDMSAKLLRNLLERRIDQHVRKAVEKPVEEKLINMCEKLL
jgi:hypothetical protein